MPYSIQIPWQAEATIESLASKDRAQLDGALSRLAEGLLGGVPEVYKVRGREGEPDLHVMQVNDRLRILFTIDNQQQIIVIHDLVSREFVRRYG